ncbi:MAG: ABC transporter permease [bacterium]
MRSPDRVGLWRVLVAKEMRELMASRSYWLLLLVVGALVGHAFMTATAAYAEASGAGGGASALSQGLNPLTGIVVPTLGAYDLAATLLFPFVVIRLVAAERETGALILMLQAPVRFRELMAAKGVALAIGWLVAGVPGLIALVWWSGMRGHVHAPELGAVVLGHLLRGVMTIGVASAAAALSASAASAAIVALTVTLGAWALDYAAAARGGALETIAQYTPEAALRQFEQGELRASTVLVMLLLGIGGLAIAAQWLRVGRQRVERRWGVLVVVVIVAIASFASSRVHISYDLSEDRRNSFSRVDDAALGAIKSPLHITVYLAGEDPRLADLQRGVFAKLRRRLPEVEITYAAKGRSGLFERAGDHYGEVWYQLGERRAMSRSATEEIVLETVYQIAGVAAPTTRDDAAYPGYPLVATPQYVSVVFLVLWPLALAGCWWATRRRLIGAVV